MVEKIEITISIIVHATEDISRISKSFRDLFDLSENEFSPKDIVGHFGNPITMLSIKLVKKEALKFVGRFI